MQRQFPRNSHCLEWPGCTKTGESSTTRIKSRGDCFFAAIFAVVRMSPSHLVQACIRFPWQHRLPWPNDSVIEKPLRGALGLITKKSEPSPARLGFVQLAVSVTMFALAFTAFTALVAATPFPALRAIVVLTWLLAGITRSAFAGWRRFTGTTHFLVALGHRSLA
jgi:hypothetical protein